MVQSKLLLKYPTLIHFFGDKRNSRSKKLLLSLKRCITVEQVHSNKLIEVRDYRKKYYQSVDGLVTKKTLFLAIKTADCLPILFFEPKRKIIAAVHAGWRGLITGIVKNTLNSMENIGANRNEIISAIGPHIGVCCYNISFNRITKFKKLGYNIPKITKQRDDNWYLDLAKIAQVDMLNFGILRQNIDIINICTSCDRRFFSYRRDKDSCGRMWNIIGRKKSA